MPLDEIRKSIESTASEEAERIRHEAEEEKEKAISEAKKAAEAIIKEATVRAEEEAKALETSHRANLDFDISSMATNARNAAIDRELLLVKKAVARELEKHMGELLKSAVKAFSKIVNKGEMTAVTSKRYASMAKAEGLGVELQETDGFIIRNGDGTVSLDATTGSLVERRASQIRELVAREIAGKPRAAAKEAKEGSKAKNARAKTAKAPKAKKDKSKKSKGWYTDLVWI